MAARVLVIDNYDSFTYNLVQYLQSLGAVGEVVLNDQISATEALSRAQDGILLSPGPGAPDDAGITLDVIRGAAPQTPIFGVCLGHQSIGQAFGGTITRAQRLMHGKTSPILHEGRHVFRGLPSPLSATRYHSLVIDPPTLPTCLEVTATTAEGEIMGVRHRERPIEGVQFHPESILTEQGLVMMENWLETL
jgi:anthranilate synthase/aminodeoxychorismate synthase-like glutamine amidotransferase